VLAEAVRRNDLTRPYLPSSPHVGPELRALGAPEEAMPEQHLWGTRPHFKAPFYSQSPAQFVSEIGYHGCPCRESLEQMLSPEALWPPEGNAEWHAKSVTGHRAQLRDASRIELMTKQLRFLFDATPDNLDDYILASQITQMEAKKFFIERWRLKPGSGGLLWWNLRDGWPVISDAAAVDYYNRRKLAFEAIRRVQANVCVMVAEPVGRDHALVAVNDTRSAAAGTVTVTNAIGDILATSEFKVGPGGRTEIARLGVELSHDLWLINWHLADGTTGCNHYLCGPTPMPLEVYRGFLPRLGLT
jgi:beta-mannosidase